MSTTLYIETTPLLYYPGTASYEWRETIAQALDSARGWFEVAVVLVGRHDLDPLMHAAVHEWNADRVLFGGNTSTGFLNAVTYDLGHHPVRQAWLLTSTFTSKVTPAARDRLAKMRLTNRVRLLCVPDDRVTALYADDLTEVLASWAKKDSA